MTKRTKQPMRTEWRDFPVFKHRETGETRKHKDFVLAKQGSDISALLLVDHFKNPEVLDSIYFQFNDRKPVLLPVLNRGTETDRIPLSMACILADRFGWDVEFDVSADKSLTGVSPACRIASGPVFEGECDERNYFLLDETMVFGTTLANLRGYVEGKGGTVIGATVLTAGDPVIKPREKTLDGLRLKFGDGLEDFLSGFLGYGAEFLTENEASYLAMAPDLDGLKDKLTASRIEMRKNPPKRELFIRQEKIEKEAA